MSLWLNSWEAHAYFEFVGQSREIVGLYCLAVHPKPYLWSLGRCFCWRDLWPLELDTRLRRRRVVSVSSSPPPIPSWPTPPAPYPSSPSPFSNVRSWYATFPEMVCLRKCRQFINHLGFSYRVRIVAFWGGPTPTTYSPTSFSYSLQLPKSRCPYQGSPGPSPIVFWSLGH